MDDRSSSLNFLFLILANRSATSPCTETSYSICPLRMTLIFSNRTKPRICSTSLTVTRAAAFLLGLKSGANCVPLFSCSWFTSKMWPNSLLLADVPGMRKVRDQSDDRCEGSRMSAISRVTCSTSFSERSTCRPSINSRIIGVASCL